MAKPTEGRTTIVTGSGQSRTWALMRRPPMLARIWPEPGS